MTTTIMVISAIVTAIATGVMAYFTYTNFILAKELKQLQVVLTAAIIYSTQKHGANYSENDMKVIINQIMSSLNL